MLRYDKHLKEYSRRLRKEMTDAEKLLWSKINGLRDRYLESVGLRVLRFSDREVFEDVTAVLEKIWSSA